MIEHAVVFDVYARPLSWHRGLDSISIPDTCALWDVVWEHRKTLGGVAHTHPGERHDPVPSGIDLGTFAAIERGLGRPLVWPIVNRDRIVYWVTPGTPEVGDEVSRYPVWQQVIEELRRRSWNQPG